MRARPPAQCAQLAKIADAESTARDANPGFMADTSDQGRQNHIHIVVRIDAMAACGR